MDRLTDTIHYTQDAWDEIPAGMARNYGVRSAFQKFVLNTYPEVRKFEFSEIPAVSDKFAMIIVAERHMTLEYVLRNVMHFLGNGWGLQIFVGNKNEEYVRSTTKGWDFVHIENLGVDDINQEEYNDFYKSPGFWQKVRGEKILCFDIDTMLCHHGIEEFTEYDYIGAPWPEKIQINPNVRVGNGGLSLRSRRAMIEICSTCKRNVIPLEDVFFSINLQLRTDEFKLPTVEVAKRFSAETIYYSEPLGIHKPWRYMSKEQIGTILSSIVYDSSDT